MYRLAMLMVLVVLIAAGCGGSGDDKSSSSDAVAQDVAADGADEKSNSDSSAKKAEKARKPQDDGASLSSAKKNKAKELDDPKTLKKLEQEGLENLPDKQKQALIETVVRSTLLRFGLKLADVDYDDGGRNLTIYITRNSACRAIAKEEANMVVAIQEGAPSVKTGRFMVAGTGQELGDYVLSCKPPKAPNGPGRIVLQHTGVGGPYMSEPFVIKSKHWALEWENAGGSLAVLLLPVDEKSKERGQRGKAPRPVGSQKPEAGRYEYKGAGTYKLQAHGAARWTVRVKEIR